MYRLCRRSALGDDLAQQVFLTAWRSLHQLRSAAAFDGWLKRIMITTWLEEVRRDKLEFAREPEEADFGSHRETTAERMDLDAALARLPPQRGSASCSRTKRACRTRRSRRSRGCRSAPLNRTSREARRGCANCWQNTKESEPWTAETTPRDDDDRTTTTCARCSSASQPRVAEQPFVSEIARRVAAARRRRTSLCALLRR